MSCFGSTIRSLLFHELSLGHLPVVAIGLHYTIYFLQCVYLCIDYYVSFCQAYECRRHVLCGTLGTISFHEVRGTASQEVPLYMPCCR